MTKVTSGVAWMDDAEWAALAEKERALLMAAVDADVRRVRETGRNRGARVEAYLSSVGLGGGFPYCAAFVTFHLLAAGMNRRVLPENPASACSWVSHPRLRVLRTPDGPCRGDVFGWCDSKRWRGHVGFVVRAYRKLGVWWIETIEANTDGAGSREGDGVYRKTRRWTKAMRLVRIPDEA